MTEERNLVHLTIDSIPITRPWSFEYTSASSQEIKESYLSKVRECEIFLLLLGENYSDHVAREYQAAVEERKPILAFIYSGQKETRQDEFIQALPFKPAPYTELGHLRELVYVAVYDELNRGYREYRSTIRQSEAPKVIEQLPMKNLKLEDFWGYAIAGMQSPAVGPVFEMFGTTIPPRDLKQLNTSLEPLYIDNLAEMQEAFDAIRNASARAKASTGDQQQAFVRELKREASDVASRYIMRLRNNEPAPKVVIPELEYFIWGVPPDFARIVRLMRPQEIHKGSAPMLRTEYEYLFRDIKHLLKVLKVMHDSKKSAGDNDEEFLRLLMVGAMHFHLGIDDDGDSKGQE